jgi:hypothetical protein
MLIPQNQITCGTEHASRQENQPGNNIFSHNSILMYPGAIYHVINRADRLENPKRGYSSMTNNQFSMANSQSFFHRSGTSIL